MIINKFISTYTAFPRRKVIDLIKQKRVKVNDKYAEIGQVITEKDVVYIDSIQIIPKVNKLYFKFHKPINVVSTTSDPRGRKTVLDYVKVSEKVYPVGRLDYDSSGLLLITNDGDFAFKLTHPRGHIGKTYLVKIDKPVTDSQIRALAYGVLLGSRKTQPCKIKKINPVEVEITLFEGMNRQIRRMFETIGRSVLVLHRIKIGNIGLDGVKPGQYKPLTNQELLLISK